MAVAVLVSFFVVNSPKRVDSIRVVNSKALQYTGSKQYSRAVTLVVNSIAVQYTGS